MRIFNLQSGEINFDKIVKKPTLTSSVAQSACLLDIKSILAVKLFIQFVVVPSPVDTIFDFRAAYRSENLPLKYEQLVLLPFGQHLRLTAVEQDWADQGLVNGEFCLA
jgi:hypothetical protein